MALTPKQRQALKDRLLTEQGGLCAVCKRPAFCSACHFQGKDHAGEHKFQPVSTLDHNHSHVGCDGCEVCARGVTHSLCNRAITILEVNSHLQNDFTRAYLSKGRVVGRLEQIDRAMQEIALCRAEGSLGAIIGELDWLTELHRLLYEENL